MVFGASWRADLCCTENKRNRATEYTSFNKAVLQKQKYVCTTSYYPLFANPTHTKFTLQ